MLKSTKSTITKFLDSYDGDISPKLASSLHDLYNWTLNLNMKISKSSNVDKITYLKKGVNILHQFKAISEKEVSRLQNEELKCRSELLKNGKCTKSQLERIRNQQRNIQQLVNDLIGCGRAGTKTIFRTLNNLSFLRDDPEYRRRLDDIEHSCLAARFEKLKGK